MSRSDDTARDRHLEAALRHAPDRDVAVPPLLRARIIAAAHRDAEASRRQRPWWRRLDAVWTPRRMGGVGTAAAAVLAATVLWVGRDEQPEAPDPRPASRVSSQDRGDRPPPPSVAATPSPPPAPPAPTTPSSPAADAAKPPQVAPLLRESDRRNPAGSSPALGPSARMAEATDGTVAVTRQAAPTDTDAAVRSPAAQAAAEASAVAEQAAQAARRDDLARRAAAAQARVPAAAAPSAPPAPERPSPFSDAAPTAAPDAPRPARAPAADRSEPAPTTPPANAPPGREQRANDSADLRYRRGAEASGTPPSAPVAPASPTGAAAPTESEATPPAGAPGATRSHGLGGANRLMRVPLVETSLAVPDPAAWRRRAPSGDEAALAPSWLPELAAATRGRWMPMQAQGGVTGVAESWTLTHPSGRTMRLSWMPGAVIVCDLRAERCEQARLEEATQEALRQGLRR